MVARVARLALDRAPGPPPRRSGGGGDRGAGGHRRRPGGRAGLERHRVDGSRAPADGTITVEPPPTLSTISIPTSGTSTVFPTTTPTFSTTSTTQPTTTTGTIQFWPPGTDGFTVVLKSTPVSEGRGPAESSAQQALNAGLPEVGILDSSNFTTLNPGYYVTFTGVYDSQNEAENALPRARSSGFPTAYVREVAD